MTLQKWLIHRAKTVRLTWPQGVADVAGIAPATLDSIAVMGNLSQVGRSTRGYIARALKISVRELEALDAGRIDWIADERIIDLDRLSPIVPRETERGTITIYPCANGTGVPILGRIIASGMVEHFDTWTPEDGPRLPVRYAGLPDAFALELLADAGPYRAGERLVFQTIPPGEIREGEWIVLTRNEQLGESELCLIRRCGADLSYVVMGARGSAGGRVITPGDILRAARVIGNHVK